MHVHELIQKIWYGKYPLGWILSPFEIIYCAVILIRRYAYRHAWLASTRLPVLVIIIGNITTGGTGKTPLVLWVAQFLATHGWRPGIISRGYGGQISNIPREVNPSDDPHEVGDEPRLLAQRTKIPVAVCKQRVKAGALLIARHDCNCLIADDGLQHYALARDVEIVVIDRSRGFGNGHCLPAGPLRESLGRLAQIPLRVAYAHQESGEHGMTLIPGNAILLIDGITSRPLAAFRETPIHAVAGIGNPYKFFVTLREAGLTVIEHPFPDHHVFHPRELIFGDDLPILLTEKDAVKCAAIARPGQWYVPVDSQMSPEFGRCLLALLEKRSISKYLEK